MRVLGRPNVPFPYVHYIPGVQNNAASGDTSASSSDDSNEAPACDDDDDDDDAGSGCSISAYSPSINKGNLRLLHVMGEDGVIQEVRFEEDEPGHGHDDGEVQPEEVADIGDISTEAPSELLTDVDWDTSDSQPEDPSDGEDDQPNHDIDGVDLQSNDHADAQVATSPWCRFCAKRGRVSHE